MTPIVLNIRANGTAQCLWTDGIELAALGQLDVRRASNVEFNPASQQWEVRLADKPDRVAYSHASRSECIRWEIETLNHKLVEA